MWEYAFCEYNVLVNELFDRYLLEITTKLHFIKLTLICFDSRKELSSWN